MDRTGERTVARLNALLDTERQALLDGRIDQLPEIARRKQALIADLAPPDSARMALVQDMQEKARRNERLLNAALEGIRAVADRIGALRQARSCLETYDRTGRKSRIAPNDRPDVERRA